MTTERDKSELRRSLRARRAALTAAQQTRAARRLARHACGTRLFRASRRIACYLAADGEIDPRYIVERIWATGKSCYLPIVSAQRDAALWFAPAEPGAALALNRFGIPEPVVPACARLRAQRLDLILLPLVAFDPEANRLGRGGGYYDRTLAFLRHRQYWRRPRVLGLAHDFQRVARLPADPWDVALDGILTDEGLYSRTR